MGQLCRRPLKARREERMKRALGSSRRCGYLMEWQCAARIMSSGGHSSGVIDGRRQDAHRRRPRDVSLRLNETTSRAAYGTAVQEEPPREKKNYFIHHDARKARHRTATVIERR